MKKATVFTDNDTHKELYKNSLFKSLFKDRKNLLDGFPGVHKGLAFPEPCLTLGGSNYTFKTTEVCDKISTKNGSREFSARYKKESKKFDVSLKDKAPFGNGVNYLLKYEERGDGAPALVTGFDWKCGNNMVWNAKFNNSTGLLKYSVLTDLGDVLKGASFAAEGKGALSDHLALKCPNYNLGVLYKSGFGNSSVAFGHKGFLTVFHSYTVDKNLSVGVEAVTSLKGATPKSPFALGATYKYDGETTIKARANKDGQVNVCVVRDVSPTLSLQGATVLDASNIPTALPAFGFKVVAKC